MLKCTKIDQWISSACLYGCWCRKLYEIQKQIKVNNGNTIVTHTRLTVFQINTQQYGIKYKRENCLKTPEISTKKIPLLRISAKCKIPFIKYIDI